MHKIFFSNYPECPINQACSRLQHPIIVTETFAWKITFNLNVIIIIRLVCGSVLCLSLSLSGGMN